MVLWQLDVPTSCLCSKMLFFMLPGNELYIYDTFASLFATSTFTGPLLSIRLLLTYDQGIMHKD